MLKKPLDNLVFKNLLNLIQQDFPLTPNPYKNLAESLGLDETAIIEMLSKGKKKKIIRQISAIFDTQGLGYKSTLLAFQLAAKNLEKAAAIINCCEGVSHNYKRNHKFNLWFTLAVPPKDNLETIIKQLAKKTSAQNYLILPTLKVFKIGVKLDVVQNEKLTAQEKVIPKSEKVYQLTQKEIQAVKLLQNDLPLEEYPFRKLCENTNFSEKEILKFAKSFLKKGVMRRFAAVLNHHNAGYVANAMVVWNVPEELTNQVGEKMASFKAVSHCYLRPAYPPCWNYNLFTMIHGRKKEDCNKIAKTISQQTNIQDYFLLFSTKEYKKERIKYFNF